MWQRAAAEQIDIAILPKSLEARFKGFQWVELQRLAPVLVVSKKNPLAKLTKIHPEKLRDKMLLGLGAARNSKLTEGHIFVCLRMNLSYRAHPLSWFRANFRFSMSSLCN